MPTETLAPPPGATIKSDAPMAPVTPDKAAARAATKEINMSDVTAGLSSRPRPGSAREAMSKNLAAIAKNPDGAVPAPETTAVKPAVTAPGAKPVATPPEGTQATVPEGTEATAEAEAAAAADATKTGDAKPGETTDAKKKADPWRVADHYKKKFTEAERRLAEIEKTNGSPEAMKAVNEQLTKATARLKELEQEIKYVDYTKSQEFQDQYQKPYDDAWKRTMTELRELTVEDGAGNVRPFSAQDMLELVNLPLPKAHELAKELFGDLAGEVMSHRMEIKRLFDKQTAALNEAKTKGEEHLKTKHAQQELQTKELTSFVAQAWKEENETALKHPTHAVHFTPIEGDEVGNAKLKKGYELVDRAFAENPSDPSLTPEQRREIISRHAAVRNRAAAYGRLVHQLSTRDARIAELEKQLAGYEKSTPDTAGRDSGKGEAKTTSAKESVLGALRKLAK